MKKELAEWIVDNAYHNSADIRENYSGRSMYGKTTTGIVTINALSLIGEMVAVASELDSTEDEHILDLLDEMKDLKTDYLGHNTIIY